VDAHSIAELDGQVLAGATPTLRAPPLTLTLPAKRTRFFQTASENLTFHDFL
jgi:hypothetical protein